MVSSAPNDRAKEIFLDATELADGPGREAYLAEACAGDPALESRVRELIAAHERADAFLGTSLLDLMPLESAGPLPGEYVDELRAGVRIADYRLVRKLGEGGFGRVWLAGQEEPVRRQVALKVLKAGMDTREVVARFEAERQALALMDHPGIAKVFGGGATERGRPYFVMELVDGVPITEYCERHDLDVAERLHLFLAVCRAVQHAHQKGVIHRDLKPSNVLVARVDGRPLPKVIDFGIAKAIGTDLDGSSFVTRGGQMVGTPIYMSPEQVEGSPDIDTRTDVYSLGVLLYGMLCGASPFLETGLREKGVAEVLRVICNEEPIKPSRRVGAGNADPSGPERSTSRILSRQLRGDLDWIVMRCLEKVRDRRYDSVAVLANDIQRHLDGEPVLAGPPSLAYRLRKFARRHRSALFVSGLFVALLVTTSIVSLSQARLAKKELSRYRAIAEFLEHVFVSLDPAVARGKDLELLRMVLKNGTQIVEEYRDESPEIEAALRRVIGAGYMSLALFDEAEPYLARALELREEALGPHHADTHQSYKELGALYLRMERLEEADRLLTQAYEGYRRSHGEDHLLTLETLGSLAIVRKEQRRFEEAETLLRDLERLRLRRLGERDPDTVLTMNNLAGVLVELGRFEEALPRLEHALEIQLETQGERHPDSLKAMNNLADLYVELDRLNEASGLLERALEVKQEILPPDHPSVIVAYNGLGVLRKLQERFEEAEEFFDEAIEHARARSGDRNSQTLILRLNRGQLYFKWERYEDAETEFHEVSGLSREVMGQVNRVALACDGALAEILLEFQRAEEAEILARKVVDDARLLYPEGHTVRGVALARLGLVLKERGAQAEALENLEAGHAILAEGHEVVWRGRAANGIADVLEAAGRMDEALRWRDLE